MSGIRKALYNHRSPTMETAETILNTAFAERRFMLDVFMTPKPLPCNQPTISLSQLAVHTGHVKDSRVWIGVHGKVYDVTGKCARSFVYRSVLMTQTFAPCILVGPTLSSLTAA